MCQCLIIIFSAIESPDHGVVLTSQPLQDNTLFEVRLDSKVSKWYRSLDVGVTSVSAENLRFPLTMTFRSQGALLVLSGSKNLNNGKEKITVSENLRDLSVCALLP